VTAPLDAAAIAAKLTVLAHDQTALATMAEKARRLCDGSGAARLADLMSLRLRPASLADGETLLLWRNDPVTRANSLDTAQVERDGHFSWLERTLKDPERVLLMAERDGAALGMARFDTMCPGQWRVSISVAPAARGQGWGGALLSAAILHLERGRGPAEFCAEIRAANRPSQRIFEDCGFVRTDSDDGVFYYRRGRPEAIS
jgi:ribosomal protein S18 acetylase RimI-like enzyme